jgi:hypothetical protein
MTSHYTTMATVSHWLPAHVWRQAAASRRSFRRSPRWSLHPLIMVLLLMTWSAGNSEAECFATARAFYVAGHQRQKRPGTSLVGFQQALARLPLSVLQALFAAVRGRLGEFAQDRRGGGFVVLACDGSRLECPRSAALERALGCCGKADSAPMLQVTALVLLPLGVLWSWCVGPGLVGEHEQLRQLLPSLPQCALLVADAGYLGYDLYADIRRAGAEFLVRVSSRAYLYTERQQPLKRYREGPVYYWPGKARKAGRPPLCLRLIRVVGRKGKDVWLLTSVREPTRLSRPQAAQMYRWRWRIEGVYRTYKRTLPKLKLRSRTEALVYREAEGSLLALQLLLLAGVDRPQASAEAEPGSPRQTLLRLRGEIMTTLGAKLGPWQQRWYRTQLQQVNGGGPGAKARRPWPRRKDHRAPKPPKLRVMPHRLKASMERQLNAA